MTRIVTNLHNFLQEQRVRFYAESPFARLSRPYRDARNVMSGEYLLNAYERGLLDDLSSRILQLFSLFHTLTVYQITIALYEQWSEEAHARVSQAVMKLYYHYFLNAIDLFPRLIAFPEPFPVLSLAFTLGPSGARYLAAVYKTDMQTIGWSKTRYFSDSRTGMHDIIVTEIVLQIQQDVQYINTGTVQTDEKSRLSLNVIQEWDGAMYVPEQKMSLRPDYHLQIQYLYQNPTSKGAIQKAMFLEYDNGTEGHNILQQKNQAYNDLYRHPSFYQLFGSISGVYPSAPVWIFSNASRKKSYELRTQSWMNENEIEIPEIFVSSLTEVYRNGFLGQHWTRLIPKTGAETEVEAGTVIFQELNSKIPAAALVQYHQSLYDAAREKKQENPYSFVNLESEFARQEDVMKEKVKINP